jgi:hypothetical protein
MGFWARFHGMFTQDPLLSRAYIDGDSAYVCTRLTSWTYHFVPDALHTVVTDLLWNITEEPHFFSIVDVDYDDEEQCYFVHLYVGSRWHPVFPHQHTTRPW